MTTVGVVKRFATHIQAKGHYFPIATVIINVTRTEDGGSNFAVASIDDRKTQREAPWEVKIDDSDHVCLFGFNSEDAAHYFVQNVLLKPPVQSSLD